MNPLSFETPNTAKKARLNDGNQSIPQTPNTPTPFSRNQSSLDFQRLNHAQPLSIKGKYANGYIKQPKAPLYTPYALSSSRSARRKPIFLSSPNTLSPQPAWNENAWNALAMQKGLIREGQELKPFQIEVANHVISRKSDVCLVAPTGAGKSFVWQLPLLAQNKGVFLVIIPFTSLGFQGEERHKGSALCCSFLHSGASSEATLRGIAGSRKPHIVYACPEMLEAPSVAILLHSIAFRDQLSAIYIDEAHSVHESTSWRPAYSRIYQLRKVVGPQVPMVVISATLPRSYRRTLELFAGLHSQHKHINLGNHRPELSSPVYNMLHSSNSFRDLSFIIPFNATLDLISATIIYADDLELLTAMFWWLRKRLASIGLPMNIVDIIHAGLSEAHQKLCLSDFNAGRTKFLLGSDKIGAGMDFKNVETVVQYGCRGLTLAKWEQRRGRGAREKGQKAIGILMVEKSMHDEKAPSQTSPGNDVVVRLGAQP